MRKIIRKMWDLSVPEERVKYDQRAKDLNHIIMEANKHLHDVNASGNIRVSRLSPDGTVEISALHSMNGYTKDASLWRVYGAFMQEQIPMTELQWIGQNHYSIQYVLSNRHKHVQERELKKLVELIKAIF